MNVEDPLKTEFEKFGRVWLRNCISQDDLAHLDNATAGVARAGERLNESSGLDAAFSKDSSLLKSIGRIDHDAVPVRTVAFNKSEKANWGVPWHQDRVIAVNSRADLTGYNNWTKKSDIWHCEAPLPILEAMLFVRVHLDDADQSNGSMEIAVGSHAVGAVPAAEAETIAKNYPIEVCTAKRGDVLVLKMLTLHSSKPAKIQSGRRVLRIDFASSKLPPPLAWIG